jgi:RNA polymerase-interacting CarD/CdnL/TRCF family regulator
MVPLYCFLSSLILLTLGFVRRVNGDHKVGIIVHGCNTRALQWDEIAWGDEQSGKMGRITQTAAIVEFLERLREDTVACISWGSGVPSIDNTLREGEYTLKVFSDRFESISTFPFFKDMQKLSLDRLKIKIDSVSHPQDFSLINTATEIVGAFNRFEQLGIDTVILVSSATHSPRCLRDASRILESWPTSWSPLLLASSAPTCYANSVAGDVVIFEPPHLPEMAMPWKDGTDGTVNDDGTDDKSEGIDSSSPQKRSLRGESASDIQDRSEVFHELLRQRNRLLQRIHKIKKDSLKSFNDDLEKLLTTYNIE